MTKTRVTIRLDEDLREKLTEQAKKEERTLSQEIRKALKEWAEFSESPKKSEEIADLSE